ncbi:hypothetical protein CLOSTHATH_06196 [Hungatella hathewayi DSM 13479]|uniref:Uncharacterized protein n=1 Tax=Hungatella hathewayi DSM 13479 TaxID=566550 RepID=D3ARE0_9FIRM|nr:hypothetical protein CLOSTHATH_06196 [Hungatella hathewayi DSM 13479]
MDQLFGREKYFLRIVENQLKPWYDKESDFKLCAKQHFNE